MFQRFRAKEKIRLLQQENLDEEKEKERKAELERRYQEEVFAPIQMAYEQKQQNIANQYGKDTLTVYNSLKGNK